MNPMAQGEEVVKSHDHRVPFFSCHPYQVGGQGDKVLEMNEVGLLLFEGFRKGLIKKVVFIIDPRTVNPREVVDHPGHPQPIHLFLPRGEFFFSRILFPAKHMDLVLLLNQSLGEIEGIKFDPRHFFRGKTVADLEDLHSN